MDVSSVSYIYIYIFFRSSALHSFLLTLFDLSFVYIFSSVVILFLSFIFLLLLASILIYIFLVFILFQQLFVDIAIPRPIVVVIMAVNPLPITISAIS